jgi:hypothetical protein
MPAWSGLWNAVHGANHALIGARNNLQMRIAKLNRREGARVDARIATALTGAAVGGTASETRQRPVAVQADTSFNLGGRRVIETVSLVNRATVAADETAIDAQLTPTFAPTTYPVDRGGGGGGKTGRL